MTDIPIITDPAQVPQTGDCMLYYVDCGYYHPHRDGCPLWTVQDGCSGLRQAAVMQRCRYGNPIDAIRAFSDHWHRHVFAATAEEAVTKYLATLPLGEIVVLESQSLFVPKWRMKMRDGCTVCNFDNVVTVFHKVFINSEWTQVRSLLDLIHEWQKNQQADGPIARAIKDINAHKEKVRPYSPIYTL